MKTFKYGLCWVLVYADHVETILPDATVVRAVPNYTEEDIARAHALGYDGDVLAMTWDHDRLHALVANAIGLPESPALRDAATGQASEIGAAEEAVILALQRLVQLCRKQRGLVL